MKNIELHDGLVSFEALEILHNSNYKFVFTKDGLITVYLDSKNVKEYICTCADFEEVNSFLLSFKK